MQDVMKSGNQSRFSLPGAEFTPMSPAPEQALEIVEEFQMSSKQNPRKKAEAVSSAKPLSRKQKESEISPLEGQIGQIDQIGSVHQTQGGQMKSNSSKKMDLSPIKQMSKGTTDRRTQNNEIDAIEK